MFAKVLIALVFLVYATHAWSDCGSKVGSVESVSVSDCTPDEKRCTLKKNTNATIGIKFKSNVGSSSLKAVVHGIVLNVPIPFALPNDDGCKDSGITCPISADQTLQYESTLPVLNSYPKVTVDVKWELQDQNGENIACVIIPSKIK